MPRKYVEVGVNDLATKRPDLVAEWDYEKNYPLTPQDVAYGSVKKVWWVCHNRHSYFCSIGNRALHNHNCPYCANQKVLAEYNDLATMCPESITDWDYEKNGNLTPSMVFPHSTHKVWWKCSVGHSYYSQISNHTNGCRCPYCAGLKVLVGFNDLESQYPSIANEWDYEKNNDTLPSDVQCHNHKKYWWRCKFGHEWKAPVDQRVYGTGCPICAKTRKVSFPEKAILFYIRKIFPDAVGNYRDRWLGNFELDIFIPSINTAIEYDGERWHTVDNNGKDERKYRKCEDRGIRLIRVMERPCDNRQDVADSVISIDDNIYKNNLAFNALVCEVIFEITKFKPWMRNGVDVDIDRDGQIIRSTYIDGVENSLLSVVDKDKVNWDYSRNDTTPDQYSPFAQHRVYWICPDCSISFKKTIANWYRGGDIRPYCTECTQKHRYVKTSLHHKKPVVGIDQMGDRHYFDSARDASEYLHNNFGFSINSYKNISACLHNKHPTAYGFTWRYADKEE